MTGVLVALCYEYDVQDKAGDAPLDIQITNIRLIDTKNFHNG